MAGGLEPTVMQLMSYFRLALRGACSLLSIVTLSGFTETGKDERDHKSAWDEGGTDVKRSRALMAPDQKARTRIAAAAELRYLEWPRTCTAVRPYHPNAF